MAIRADLRQSFPSRPARPRRLGTPLVAAALVLAATASAATLADRWSAGTPVPKPWTEVAAARFGNEIGVVGGSSRTGLVHARGRLRAGAERVASASALPTGRQPRRRDRLAWPPDRRRRVRRSGRRDSPRVRARRRPLAEPPRDARVARGRRRRRSATASTWSAASRPAGWRGGRSCSTSARGVGAASSGPSRASTSPLVNRRPRLRARRPTRRHRYEPADAAGARPEGPALDPPPAHPARTRRHRRRRGRDGARLGRRRGAERHDRERLRVRHADETLATASGPPDRRATASASRPPGGASTSSPAAPARDSSSATRTRC